MVQLVQEMNSTATKKTLCAQPWSTYETCPSSWEVTITKASIWYGTRTSLLLLYPCTLAAHTCKPLPMISMRLQTDWRCKIKVLHVRHKTTAFIQIFNRITPTSWSVLIFFVCVSFRIIHSKAISYSIVLGWEQCDVNTALLCRTDSCIKYQAKEKRKTSQSLL